MSQYLLLLHETPADSARITPAEMQEIIQRHQAWAADLAQKGQLLSGEKLTDDGGRHLRLAGGRPLASDGPYAEAHDVIGGFYLVQADNDLAAEAIAARCPHLEGRQWIELRRIEVVG
ncbi:MAG: transcription initiation protein [Rubrivivax sp.]|nr:transcription initiation protein [Rubrivivax sp.]